MSYPTAQSHASSVRPLLAGDELEGQLIRGFAWAPPTGEDQRSNHHDDKLLLDGDEGLPEPPNRAVPTSSDGAVPKAPVPPADLGSERVLRAAEIDSDLAARVNALLDLPTAQWQPVIRPLLAAVHSTGHRLWLSGGAVRDSVSNVPLGEINDLDMAGTAPPGRFMDMMYQALRASGRTEHLLSVSKDSLICSVAYARNKRYIEYRGLSLGGFRFPAVGSRLAEDARHRDFSFNALIYDALDHVLFDPTGHGLADLLRKPRTFRPIKESDSPYELATVVIRAMKFALRWPGQVDLDLFHRWLHTLPADIWRSLSEDELSRLRVQRQRLKYPRGKQREFAATVPEPGRELLMSLFGRV
jgi:poly(A) polymerase